MHVKEKLLIRFQKFPFLNLYCFIITPRGHKLFLLHDVALFVIAVNIDLL